MLTGINSNEPLNYPLTISVNKCDRRNRSIMDDPYAPTYMLYIHIYIYVCIYIYIYIYIYICGIHTEGFLEVAIES